MRILIIVIGLLILLFSACNNPSSSELNKTVFNYNELNGVTSLDPAAAANFENIWPVNQMFNGLIEMDDHLNLQSGISKSFEISDDQKMYTFHLRTDVYFHDNVCFEKGKGRKVLASDFVFSFYRLYDSKVSSAAGLLEKVDRNEKNHYKGFEALNDSTFRIYLKEPFAPFLSILSMKYFSVLPFEAMAYYQQDFRKNPVGTGPFQFKMWDEGSKLILVKNPNYFEFDSNHVRLPYLDAVTVSFIKDKETAFMEFLAGKFDMLSGADAFNTSEVLNKEGDLRDFYSKKFVLQKEVFLKTDYIGFLVDSAMPVVKQSPIKLRALRKAINMGFDRNKLIKYLRNNVGFAATSGFIPKGMNSFNTDSVKGYSYNPDRVKQLLIEAGYPNGKGLPEIVMHITDTYKEQAEFIQSQLAENNIRVQISIDKPSVLRQAVNSGEYDFFKKSWVADYPDEDNFMGLFYSKNFTPQGVNFFHFSNPTFDGLYEKALNEPNQAVKNRLYQAMERIIIEESPVVPLYYDEVVRLVHKNIQNLGTNPMNLLNLKKVKKNP
ncbi:MAG: ABC transporter substrate-binding protein [Bacteroidota bacterium]